MAARKSTKPGTRKLSEVARHVVKPSGIVATGWPRVEQTAREKLGITFDEWQCGAGRLILARRQDGKLAAMVGGVGMSLPRQVGKTYLLAGLLFALCVENPGLLVIWSAHHSKTHNETFLAMQGFAKRLKVAPYVAQVYTGSGDEAVVFVNDSRILFGARERGFGRGIPGVDVLVMDEAQILSDKALENMLATLNTSQLGLALYVGTPPRPEDNSEAFTRMRTEAIAGGADDLVWIECAADPDADPYDEKQWAKANPSFPHRTPRESILRLLRRLKPDGFRHEGLGIWDDDHESSIFPRWSKLARPAADPPTVLALGIATDRDQTWLSLGAVVDGERPHLAIADRQRATDRKAFAENVARIQRERGCEVLIRGKNFLIPDLEDAGVAFRLVDSFERAQAHADLATAIANGEVEHGDYPELNAAITIAQWRVTDTGRSLDAKVGDISALDAVALALHGVEAALTYDPLASIL